MSNDLSRDIAAMLGSRICHDLISPIGAISNGLELLTMTGVSAGPEIGLISESVANANSKIKFFRLAFGLASSGQMANHAEMVAIFKSLSTLRIQYEWAASGDLGRGEAKLACLLVMCLESALPRGGRIRVTSEGDRLEVAARAEKIAPSPDLWARLGCVSEASGIKPAEVQFVLAPIQAAAIGRRIVYEQMDESLRLIA